ncbi:MAG: hypothetical protein QOH36_1578 [Actinomycetota bacterium]|nr:hypothetical protein [Actinomycetota bacterium]
MSDSGFSIMFGWLHISDIHSGQGEAADAEERRDIVRELSSDVRDLCARGTVNSPDAAIITGDLTQSGGSRSSDEFVEVSEFIDMLRADGGCPEGIMVVPGNHDLDRTVGKGDADFGRMMQSLRAAAERIDDSLTAPARSADLGRLKERFAAFEDWVRTTPGLVPFNGDLPLTWRSEWKRNGVVLSFRGLNSAWLAADDADQGKLQVGLAQLRNGKPRGATRINVLAMHHPLDWLRDGDQVGARIARDYDILLSGHMHHPRLATLKPAGLTGRIGMEAGATYKPEQNKWTRDGGHTYSLCFVGLAESQELQLRVWPRVWDGSRAKFVVDSRLTEPNLAYAIETLRGPPAGSAGRSPPMAPTGGGLIATLPTASPLAELSATLLRRYGRRRTAFPTDLSLSELADAKLVVLPRFGHAAAPQRSVAADELIIGMAKRENVLLLGSPGIGKSVALYELAQLARVRGITPLVYRLSELRRLFASGEEFASLQNKLANAAPEELPVFFVDGLDEAGVTDGSGARNLSSWLSTLAEMGPLAASCRSVDFERHLAAYVEPIGFEKIVTVSPWRAEVEFRSFIEKLVAADHLPDLSLSELALARDALRRLVEIPLFARMLTLIGPADSTDVASEEDLYFRFFTGLDIRTKVLLVDAGCEIEPSLFSLWEEAAWTVFASSLIRDEAVNYPALLQILGPLAGGEECARRAVYPILDVGHRVGEREAEFIHYSFYEYLLASAIVRRLSSESTAENTVQLVLGSDLPRRVRHFIAGRLRADGKPHVPALLKTTYEDLRRNCPLEQARPGCNLIVYILSRAFESDTLLRELLAIEVDDFLRNSLRWGLCHRGAIDVAVEFISELDYSARFAAMCRGYLLYYHGDLSRDNEPPYFDNEPIVSWSRTRAAVSGLMSNESYGRTVPIARQVIDLYTFYSFALVRDEQLNDAEAGICLTILEEMWSASAVASRVLHRLQAMHAATTSAT